MPIGKLLHIEFGQSVEVLCTMFEQNTFVLQFRNQKSLLCEYLPFCVCCAVIKG